MSLLATVISGRVAGQLLVRISGQQGGAGHQLFGGSAPLGVDVLSLCTISRTTLTTTYKPSEFLYVRRPQARWFRPKPLLRLRPLARPVQRPVSATNRGAPRRGSSF